MNRTLLSLAVALLMSPLAAAAADPPATTVAAALTGGHAELGFRLRSETVDDASFAKNANSLTLRSRLTYTTGSIDGFRAVVEVDDIRALGDDYNSTSNGRTDRPIVADPAGTDVNRAALEWTHGPTQVSAGRQRLILDNHRFVGNVGWRQNEQTYDGVVAKSTALPHVELLYGYLYNVNRVYGPTNGAQAAEWHGRVHVLHAKIDAGTIGTLTPFGYWMDFHNAAAQSNASYGLIWSRAFALGDGWQLPVSATGATQSDAGDNATAYSAHYWQLEAGVAHGGLAVRLGREVLSGDATRAGHRFQTPLATLHVFQGWVDKFLVTPPQGIEDTYVSVSDKINRLTLQAAWHDFRAAAVSRSYGDEWNASAALGFGGHYEALLKAGRYHAAGAGSDTTKVWAMLSATF